MSQEIKLEKLEADEKPVIYETTIQEEIIPMEIKQEYEENYELQIPQHDIDEDYGEIEVLDEFVDQVPHQVKVEIKEEPLPVTEVKVEPSTSKMSLRGVKINVTQILGTRNYKPRAAVATNVDPSTIQVPNCFNHFERPFKCKKCPLSFKHRKELTMHRALHKKADFWCQKCGQKFRFQTSYYNHECDFVCNICGKEISNKANLKIHLSYVHGIGEAKLFTCDLCGTTYKSKRNIDTHMKNHMESTPFNCAICNKGFSHAGALKIHMWNHRDLVHCEICKKKFKPRSLYYHIKRCRMIYEQDQLILAQMKPPTVIKMENVKYKIIHPQPVIVIKKNANEIINVKQEAKK